MEHFGGMIKGLFCAILAILLSLNLAHGKVVPGYIVKNNSDTIYGEIKILRFDIYTNGVLLSGINLEQFHTSLSFREKNCDNFKLYTPEDIAGFGFLFKSTEYRFKTFTIVSNSIFKSERKRLRFLNLIYQGEVALYKDIVRIVDHGKSNSSHGFTEYYDYYLFDNKRGLVNIASSMR